MTKVIKAGRLANGWERGNGNVVHLVDSDDPYIEAALCGARPAKQWSVQQGDVQVTCKKCLQRQEDDQFVNHGSYYDPEQ